MNEKSIKNIFLKAVKSRTNYEVKDSSTLEDLAYDSLDVIELIMDCEKDFDITLPDKVCDNYLGDDWRSATINDYISLIKLRLGEVENEI